MELPKSLKIGPHKFAVVLVPDGVMDDAGRFGHASLQRLVIALDSEQPDSQLLDTLLHEVLHAMLAPMGLEDEIEERLCLFLAPAILLTIQDNPELWKVLALEG